MSKKYAGENTIREVIVKTKTLLNNKVDKVNGKTLTSNDFTNTYKTKLDGIATGAEVNVQADWSQTNNLEDDFIRNKPTIPTKTSELTNDSNFATESYVDTNGGKIDTISVNSVNQTIVNKNVNITVPTKVSDLTNDASYISGISSSDVTTALGYTPYNATNPSGYTKVESSNTNGNIKINGSETAVYTLPNDVARTSDIPTNNNQLTNGAGYQTASDVSSAISSNNTSVVTPIGNRVTTIEGKIPSQASSTNQLADKSFVNSSISTATATFRGTFTTLSALEATSGDLNDYAYLIVYDTVETSQVKQYDRYKHNGTGWAFEYTLNNSSFTQAQWNAINSGITSALVTQIGTNQSNITSLSTNKQDAITSSNKLSASLVSGLAAIATSGNLSDATTDSTHRVVTDTEKSTWSGKQDAITSSNKLDYSLIDNTPTIPDISTKADVANGVYFVQGTSSAAGNSTSGSYLSTKWEGTVSGVATAYNGLKLVYRIGGNAGVSTAGAVLSIDGTNYYPVVYNVNSVIGDRYSVGSNVVLTFNSTQTATAYLTSNTSSTITGCWQIMDYDDNSYAYMRMYNLNTTNGDRDLVMRYDTGSIDGGSYANKYGAITSNVGLKANPSTGQLKAVIFTENGVDLANKYATKSSVPTIVLNGASISPYSFYAPTSAGTSGYFLKSNGSGNAPTWQAISTNDFTSTSVFLEEVD